MGKSSISMGHGFHGYVSHKQGILTIALAFGVHDSPGKLLIEVGPHIAIQHILLWGHPGGAGWNCWVTGRLVTVAKDQQNCW